MCIRDRLLDNPKYIYEIYYKQTLQDVYKRQIYNRILLFPIKSDHFVLQLSRNRSDILVKQKTVYVKSKRKKLKQSIVLFLNDNFFSHVPTLLEKIFHNFPVYNVIAKLAEFKIYGIHFCTNYFTLQLLLLQETELIILTWHSDAE